MRAAVATLLSVAGGREIGAAEAELLVLRADAPRFARLTAVFEVFCQLPNGRDRRGVGVSGVGHIAPGVRVLSNGSISPRLGPATAPPRSGTPGPRCKRFRHAGCVVPARPPRQKAATAQFQAPSEQNPLRADQQARGPCPAGTEGAGAAFHRRNSVRPTGQEASRVVKLCGLRRIRGHSAARSARRLPIAIASRRSGLTRVAIVRSVSTGIVTETPSSVAFCTTRSVASRFRRAKASHRSGSACLRAKALLTAKRRLSRATEPQLGQAIRRRAIEHANRVADRPRRITSLQIMRLASVASAAMPAARGAATYRRMIAVVYDGLTEP